MSAWASFILLVQNLKVGWVFSTFMFVSSVSCTYFFAGALRNRRPDVIYILFFLYCLFICIGILVKLVETYLIDYLNAHPLYSDVSARIFYLFRSSVDVSDEMIAIGLISFIVIVPQIMAYILAGIFGCGKSPRYVLVMSQYLMITFSKTLISWSGFILGYYFIWLPIHVPISDINTMAQGMFAPADDLYTKIMIYLALLNAPFVYCTFAYTINSIENADREYSNRSKIHRFFTRHSQH